MTFDTMSEAAGAPIGDLHLSCTEVADPPLGQDRVAGAHSRGYHPTPTKPVGEQAPRPPASIPDTLQQTFGARLRNIDSSVYLSRSEFDDIARQSFVPNEAWFRLAPDHSDRRPLAILPRQVATPNYEMLWFTRLAERHGFQPLVIEHRSDRFTVNNSTKYHLGRLPIVVGRSRNGQVIIRNMKMLDVTQAEGCPLDQVRMLSGEPLIDFHHRKLAQVLGDQAPHIVDMTQVVDASKHGPAAYYSRFFRMLTGPVVLFEDFVVDDRTAAFFSRTVLPAYHSAVEATGRKPQIMRLVPGPQMSSSLWISYPAAMAEDQQWIRNAPTTSAGAPAIPA